MSRDVMMMMALYALENSQRYVEASADGKFLPAWREQLDAAENAIVALRAALDAPEQQPIGALILQGASYDVEMEPEALARLGGGGAAVRVPLYAGPMPARHPLDVADTATIATLVADLETRCGQDEYPVYPYHDEEAFAAAYWLRWLSGMPPAVAEDEEVDET